jgi:hypothetical protein
VAGERGTVSKSLTQSLIPTIAQEDRERQKVCINQSMPAMNAQEASRRPTQSKINFKIPNGCDGSLSVM